MIEIGGELHDPAKLRVLEPLMPETVTKRPHDFRKLVDKPRGEIRSDGVWLPPKCIAYLRDGDLSVGDYATPSEAEQSLLFYLVIAGLSDEEIMRRAYGQFHSLQRRMNQNAVSAAKWIMNNIWEARRFALDDYHRHILTFPEGGKARQAKRLIELSGLLGQCESLAEGQSATRSRLVYELSVTLGDDGRNRPQKVLSQDAKRKLDRALREGLLEELPDGSLRRSYSFFSLSTSSTHSSTPPLPPGTISGPEPIHVPVESSKTRLVYERSVTSGGSTQDGTEQGLGTDWAAVEPREGHRDRQVYDDSVMHNNDEEKPKHASTPIPEKDLTRDGERIDPPDGREFKPRPGGLYDRLQVRHPDKLPPRTYHDDGRWTYSDEACVEKPAYEPTDQEREEHKRACDEIDHLLVSSGRPRKDEGGL